jgi:hypothetical protein
MPVKLHSTQWASRQSPLTIFDVTMSSSPYETITEIHKWFHNYTCRLITLDDDPPPLSPPTYVILGDGDVDIMEPITELFGLDCIRKMNHVCLRCPIVIRVYPGTQMSEFKCKVSIKRVRDNTFKFFSESTNESEVAGIITQAHIAGSMPDLSFEEIKGCRLDREALKRFNEEKMFTGNEVCVEFHGLQLPSVEICALPGPRAEFAGGENIEKIIQSYLDKEDSMTIVVHLADVPLATSWSLRLLENNHQRNCAGLIVRRRTTSYDNGQVTQALSRGHRADLTLGWFQESSLDRLHSAIVYHNIATTIPWYVLLYISEDM